MAAQAAVSKSVDNPANINAFLARIGGSLLRATEQDPDQDASTPSPVAAAASDHGSDSKGEEETAGGVHLDVSDNGPSPASAAPATAAMDKTAEMPSIAEERSLEEDLGAILKLVDKSRKGLKDSKHAVRSVQDEANPKSVGGGKKHGQAGKLSPLVLTSSKVVQHTASSAAKAEASASETAPFAAVEEAGATAFVGPDEATVAEASRHNGDGVAAPRKVILAGLPSNAGLSLVASLLHGGALESFSLAAASDADTTKQAVALFTDSEAAHKYCAMHANGVHHKPGSKKIMAWVELAKECDAPSAVLQGHLEAGASRAVRVSGADEDWSMRGLCKLAGESDRKLESICDYWRDEVRKIDFLFTNIADAVHFRAQLLHDAEWRVCSIQFAEDPCEKATGVRTEP